MAGRVLDRPELAAKLNKSVAWTYRHLKALPGFPPQVLPGCWYEPAVDAWLHSRSTGEPPLPANDGQTPPADELAEAERRMLERLGA